MASILAEPFKGITSKELIALNFNENNWGRPDRIFYPTTPSESRDGTMYRECYWNDDKKYWEYFLKADEIGIYEGVIYYFPETFNAYVTEFQGNGGCGKSKHPAGYLYAFICRNRGHESADLWKDVIKVDSVEDINLGIAMLESELNKLFEERRKGWQTYNLYIHNAHQMPVINYNSGDVHQVSIVDCNVCDISNKLTLKTSYV